MWLDVECHATVSSRQRCQAFVLHYPSSCFAVPSGIEHDVAAKLQQVRFPFNQDRLEPPLKQMSSPVVPAVKTLSVNAVELAHADRKVRLGRLPRR